MKKNAVQQSFIKQRALGKASALGKVFMHQEGTFGKKNCPITKGKIRKIIALTLNAIGLSYKANIEICLLSKDEIRAINFSFRGKDQPTNILSFSNDDADYCKFSRKGPKSLGELLISPEVIFEESQNFNISLSSRWKHLLIHGTLHLLGYDHEKEEERRVMELMEKNILKVFNISDPYLCH